MYALSLVSLIFHTQMQPVTRRKLQQEKEEISLYHVRHLTASLDFGTRLFGLKAQRKLFLLKMEATLYTLKGNTQ